MLQGCPNLTRLYLSIYFEGLRVEKVLVKEDFVVNPVAKGIVCEAETSTAAQEPKVLDLHNTPLNDLLEIQSRFGHESVQFLRSPQMFPRYRYPPPRAVSGNPARV